MTETTVITEGDTPPPSPPPAVVVAESDGAGEAVAVEVANARIEDVKEDIAEIEEEMEEALETATAQIETQQQVTEWHANELTELRTKIWELSDQMTGVMAILQALADSTQSSTVEPKTPDLSAEDESPVETVAEKIEETLPARRGLGKNPGDWI
jgi:Mg2+ and Co2+ transporter CorA